MRWNLRLAAANRGIWKASELQRMLAGAGLVISAGKMSGLWSGTPASIKLADLADNCDLARIAAPVQRDFKRIAKYCRAIALIRDSKG